MASAQRTYGTPKKRAQFLAALREGANVRSACEKANIGRTQAYRWRDDDAEFAAAWDSALEDACDKLEQVAWQRAEDVSDTLLIFLLKAHRPAKYREPTQKVSHEHSGPGGQPLTIAIQFDAAAAFAAVTAGSAADRASASDA